MKDSRTILVGCDDTRVLSLLLGSLNNADNYMIISAVRISDLISIVKSVNPSFIVLCFRSNQSALNNICTFLKTSRIPILCLARKFQRDTFSWTSDNAVFINSLEDALKPNFLIDWFNSVLLLMQNNRSESPENNIHGNSQSSNLVKKNYKKLSRYTLEIDQKQAILKRIQSELLEIYNDVSDPIRSKLSSIVNTIKSSTLDKRHWQDFKMYFEHIEPGFLSELLKKHPNLTPKDLKYCCYLRMNMSNNDIKNLLCINKESVRTHKYRLKKKLRLSKNQDLKSYTRSLKKLA